MKRHRSQFDRWKIRQTSRGLPTAQRVLARELELEAGELARAWRKADAGDVELERLLAAAFWLASAVPTGAKPGYAWVATRKIRAALEGRALRSRASSSSSSRPAQLELGL